MGETREHTNMPTPIEEIRCEFLALRAEIQSLASRWSHMMDKIGDALQLEIDSDKLITKRGGAMVPPAKHLCPFCGAPMVHRNGRYGPFWGCSQYPECEGTRDLEGNNTSRTGCKKLPRLKASSTKSLEPDTTEADKQLSMATIATKEEEADVPF
jgi:hypothetical protein